jgi:membrane-bound lytic murein transglycosylase B
MGRCRLGRDLGKGRDKVVEDAPPADLDFGSQPAGRFRNGGAFVYGRRYATLTLIDRGTLSARTHGSMHGEIGQTQFMPKNILTFGTGGNLDSAANALASTANFLRGHGWRAGAGYQPGEANFGAIQAWNAASAYQRAIAVIGQQIDGGNGTSASR